MKRKQAVIGAAAIGAAVSAGFLPSGQAGAAVTTPAIRTAFASDDAYVSSTRTTTNFGEADKLVIGGADGETRTTFVKFSTGGFPTGATLSNARLILPYDGKPDESRVSVYPVTGDWSENAITSANQPQVGSAAIASAAPRATDASVTIDLSGVVTKAGTYSFAVRSASTTAITRFRSAESGADGGPRLVVNYTPVSAAPTAAPVPESCVTDNLLVPNCGVLWGAAAGGFTDTPRDTALKNWETLTGRTSTIYHTYHKGDEKFPTKAEIAMTRDAAHPRVLLLNWKVAYGSTWAKVAAGQQDARIDAWANYVKANYSTQKFFLALHHEPENDVQTGASSGMTAKDFAAMYRHVIERLRADKVTNVVNVVAYMGNEKWMAQSWWKDLYPGDDVVDWIGLDSYVSVEKGYYHFGDFGSLLDRKPTGGGLGFYDWSATNHPKKPIMVAEWGMYHRVANPTSKAAAFNTVVPQLLKHSKIKAVVYFDTAQDNEGDRNIAVDSTADSLTAFRKVAAEPLFNVELKN
ncbi:DNRLRE domain-containing protein [Actinoplanes sp. NPDC026619]|uniref:CBM96 family carbohydrate-binding protein n=1 Tax=Actinoplanes sp. NPDC026619 TaxID=3155798 RepID=UPI0033EC4A1B